MPFEMKKVFDCQDDDFPREAKDALFNLNDCGNDVCVEFTVKDPYSYEEGECEDTDTLVNYLISAGCKEKEEVIIKYWW